MKPGTFARLLVVTVIVAAFAIVSYSLNNRVARPVASGAPLVTGLAAVAQRVARIEIRQGGKAVELARSGDGWVLANRDGYPVKPEPVRALLVKLSEADLVEPKTKEPERFGLLDLEDPAGKDSKSRLLRLADDKGGVVTELVLGKRRLDAFGANRSGTYVRRPGDPQTWLASVDIDASANVRDWVAPGVLDLQPAKISAVTIEVPGEQPLNLTRDAAGGASAKFNLVGLPEGKKLKEGAAIDSIVRAAGTLDLDDVRKAPAGAKADAGTVTIEGDGGLKVVLALRKDGDDTWGAITGTGDGESKAPAETLAKKTAGWEFKLPSGKAAAILKRQSDLIEGS